MSAGPPPLAPGLRQTRQRQEVWDAVGRLGGHCTADQVTAEAQRASPGFPRSTVYRALDALTASGALHAVRLGGGAVHYEVASGEHQHAVCSECQGIIHIEHELVAELENHLARRHRFTSARTEVLVIGRCAACADADRAATPAPRPLPHIH